MDRLSLNVFLLKSGGKLSAAVNFAGLGKSLDIPIDANHVATLKYGLVKGTPDWFTSLASQASAAPSKAPETSSLSGVLIVPTTAATFILTFGHGWQKVNRSKVEPNFGLRCVLNLADRNKLKSIKRDRIADDFVQAIEQIPDADDIYRFDIDTEKDLLTGVKARVDESDNFGLQVSGTDSFKASIDFSTESIGDFLDRCKLLHQLTAYKSKFSWVDNVLPVRDDALIIKLEAELAKHVAAGRGDLSLCVPDLLAWDDYDLFTYETRRGAQSPVAYALSPSAWVTFALTHGVKIDAAALKQSFVYGYQQASKTLKRRWRILDCLHGSISHKGKTYLAHGGQWFELDRNFVADIDAKVASIPINATTLPPLASINESEGAYNARVAAGSAGTICLLDKKNVPHGGGRSRIEVCDLFRDSGELICVKPWGGGSASLSHLFQQATVAARLISDDTAFNSKVRSKLPATHHAAWDSICAKNSNPDLVLAVLRGPAPSKLPFFARLALSTCVASLRQMRFRPSYLAIP